MREPRPLRFVHTSDVHLGAYSSRGDAKWTERRSLMEETFARVIDLANESDADALMIAGDFFDNDKVDDATVHFAGEQIRRFKGRTFLIPGNHDPMDDGRIYWRYDLEAMAPRLKILREHPGEVVVCDELDLLVWGRAYIDTDWHFRPLEGRPPERFDGRWHVAMAHGHFVPDGREENRSLPIREHEIASGAGHWDYVALGHWEPHRDVSSGGATAVYSGAPMALSDSNRAAGWAIVVDMDHDGTRWTRHRVDPRGDLPPV
ncbi:MAG: DNA repair exonuclease [Dehalococcoidia bacterium]|nr:DNA repair exonuclease [Dehalococcoidia bacterium]